MSNTNVWLSTQFEDEPLIRLFIKKQTVSSLSIYILLVSDSVSLNLKHQYVLVLMPSFFLVLPSGCGGQDGMIKQPLSDELIHSWVPGRKTTRLFSSDISKNLL